MAPSGSSQGGGEPVPEGNIVVISMVQEQSDISRLPVGFVPLINPVPLVNVSAPDTARRAEPVPEQFTMADQDSDTIEFEVVPSPAGSNQLPPPFVNDVCHRPVFPNIEGTRPAASEPAPGVAAAQPEVDRSSDQSWLQAATTTVWNFVAYYFLPAAYRHVEAPAPSPGNQDATAPRGSQAFSQRQPMAV